MQWAVKVHLSHLYDKPVVYCSKRYTQFIQHMDTCNNLSDRVKKLYVHITLKDQSIFCLFDTLLDHFPEVRVLHGCSHSLFVVNLLIDVSLN